MYSSVGLIFLSTKNNCEPISSALCADNLVAKAVYYFQDNFIFLVLYFINEYRVLLEFDQKSSLKQKLSLI